MTKIVEAIIAGLTTDAPVREVQSSSVWVAVWSRYCGLASTLASTEYAENSPAIVGAHNLTGQSARKLAELALSEEPLEATVGMAALNSLLAVDESLCKELNARDLLLKEANGKRMALVGHFPFVPELREVAKHLDVLELRPRPGDLPADEAERVIPQADVVAITGTAFLNHTMEQLLSYRRPDALVVVLGPTTPLSPVLFDFGVDIVSGIRVLDPPLVLKQVAEGFGFRRMQGLCLLTLRRR